LVAFTGLVTAGTLPWIIATGFYRQQGRIPRAWPLLNLPGDFWLYAPVQPVSAAAGIIAAALIACVFLMKPRVSQRLTEPAKRLGPVFLFLSLWAAVGYATFFALVPAASFDRSRLNLSYWGPLFLLASAGSAAIARVLLPRHSVVLAPVVLSVILFATGHRLNLNETFSSGSWKEDAIVLDHLGTMFLDRTTKLYAAPNDSLILSFYSGLPVQDITPVRKSYLDSYRGDIVYIDRSISVDTGFLSAESIRVAALQNGVRLSPEAAETWSILLSTRDYREDMLKSVAHGTPQELEPLPPFGQRLLAEHHSRLPLIFTDFSSFEPVLRGFDITSWSECRFVLRYRFVGPAARSGIHANYAARLRGADAVILPQANTALYLSRWHPPNANDGIEFRFVR
jgi:hypothetical protein